MSKNLKKLTTLGYWYLRWFSQPACDRTLYQTITKIKPISIVEIGLASIERAQNIVRVAQRASETTSIKYCGIDLFEGRPKGRSLLSLKDTHCDLQKTNARIRLIPGEFHDSLPRVANQLGKNDLVLITTDQSPETIAAAWYYVPRIINEYAVVLFRDGSNAESPYLSLNLAEVNNLAMKHAPGIRKVA